jgi:hypothetical protein
MSVCSLQLSQFGTDLDQPLWHRRYMMTVSPQTTCKARRTTPSGLFLSVFPLNPSIIIRTRATTLPRRCHLRFQIEDLFCWRAVLGRVAQRRRQAWRSPGRFLFAVPGLMQTFSANFSRLLNHIKSVPLLEFLRRGGKEIGENGIEQERAEPCVEVMGRVKAGRSSLPVSRTSPSLSKGSAIRCPLYCRTPVLGYNCSQRRSSGPRKVLK